MKRVLVFASLTLAVASGAAIALVTAQSAMNGLPSGANHGLTIGGGTERTIFRGDPSADAAADRHRLTDTETPVLGSNPAAVVTAPVRVPVPDGTAARAVPTPDSAANGQTGRAVTSIAHADPDQRLSPLPEAGRDTPPVTTAHTGTLSTSGQPLAEDESIWVLGVYR